MNKFPKPHSKNWEEDYDSPDDNGCYQNRCVKCRELFFGHKYRRICKLCTKALEEQP